MGFHYLPQEYLRGFAVSDNPKLIWMYDKQTHRFSSGPLAIKKVAQEEDYYDPDVEKDLNIRVEMPVNPVLQKLRSGTLQLNDQERTDLAFYISVMLRRVPARRRRVLSWYPDQLEQSIKRTAAILADRAESVSGQMPTYQLELAKLDQTHEKFKAKQPEEFTNYVRTPWPTETLLNNLNRTTWRIISTNEDAGWFLTSDNPAVHLDRMGHPLSELVFPLATNVALVANWQGRQGETIFITKAKNLSKRVREINQRVAYGAERFVFFRAKEDWVRQMADRLSPHLSPMKW